MGINDAERFASIFEGMELISSLLARYTIVEEIYLQLNSKAVELLK